MLERIELEDVGIELRLTRSDRDPQSLHPLPCLLEFDGQRRNARRHFIRRFFQAPYFRFQCAGALHERRVRRSSLSASAAQLVGRLSRFEKTTLRRGQPLVGAPLILVQPRDRGARLFLAALQLIALFLGLTPFARKLFAFLRQTSFLIGDVLQLRLETDDSLFLLVQLGGERRDRRRRLRNRRLQFRGLCSQAGERVTVGRHSLAQLLDLAFRFEDAARHRQAAARHQMRSAEHVTLDGGHRQRRHATGSGRSVVGLGDPAVTDCVRDSRRVRAVDAHDR